MESLITTVKSVSEIISDFHFGNIAVPEIQRDVVWTSEQIKDLIDSISRGYPCGALIFWEPREKDQTLVKSMIRPERLELHDGALPRYFLLDGQQRITALASVLLPRDEIKKILLEFEEEMPFFFANLKSFPSGTKQAKPPELEATNDPAGYGFPWILFNKLFDSRFVTETDFSKLPTGSIETIRTYVQRLRDYQFPVQIIRDRDYSSVGEIFTRVNSAGTQLTGAEIHLARIVPHWKGITREFRDYRRELRKNNYDLDLTFLMRTITVIECNVPQIKKLADRISKDQPTRAHLNKLWKQSRGAIDGLIKILRCGLSLDKSKFFMSKNALIPLVYSLAKVGTSRALERDVQKFFLLSQISEHYSAAAETQLRRDFRQLTDSSQTAKDGLAELVANVNQEARQYFRGLKVQPKHVYGVASKNVLVLLIYIIMRKNEATDWGTGNRPTLDAIEPSDLQLHHIFPFDYMTKNKALFQSYLDQGFTPADFRADVNDIANLTLISKSKNVEISDTPPSQYLLNETIPQMRKAHFIPENQDLWKTENFQQFLEERRRLMAVAMTKLLKRL
ncbi:MAG TPA: DUF262 domain-containing protein [Urbifossiella sp.]|nr:DUF262 domain-containing protein [Urbifossiella sp.]